MNEIVKNPVAGKPVKAADKVSYGAFDEFADSAKSAVSIHKELGKALKSIYDHCPLQAIEAAQNVLRGYDRYGCKVINGCKTQGKIFDPEDAYSDYDGVITKVRVSKHIALLIGSFPNANPADPETYTKMLIEEVVAAAPMVSVLEAACRKLRRSSKFIPTISEVLGAIEAEDRVWNDRWNAINYSNELADDLRQAVAEQIEKRAAADRDRAARPNGFAIGDRVSHLKFGSGTVRGVDGNKIDVDFEAVQGTKRVVADFIRRES